MKFRTKWYIAIFFMIAIICLLVLMRPANDKKGVSVSVLLPLSGDLAFLGEPGQAAINIAKEEMPTPHSLSIKILDTKAEPRETITLLRKEMDVYNTRIFIVTLSGPSMAAREVLNKSDALLLSVSIHPDIPSTDSPIVRFCLSAKQEGAMISERLVKEKGNIGLVVSRDAATTFEVESTILPAMKEAGLEPAFVEWFDVGNKDFKNVSARVRATKPTSILLLGYGSDFPGALEAIANSGPTKDLKVYGGIGFVELSERPLGFEGTLFHIVAPAFAVGVENTDASIFREKYKKATGKPAPYDAAFTYDAIKTLDRLVREGNVTPKSLLNSMRNKTFYGVTGKIVIGPDGEAGTDLRWSTLLAKGLVLEGDN